MRSVKPIDGLSDQARERLVQRVTAATYGTVLVLAALPLIKVSGVASGVGWELVTGVGIATYIAHAYAEVMGDHVRRRSSLDRAEVARAMRDGVPILYAAVGPASALGLGGINVLSDTAALWVAVTVAVLQLVGLGLFVGWAVTPRRSHWWVYGVASAAMGVVVVALKLGLSH
jgi:hypothetical protein